MLLHSKNFCITFAVSLEMVQISVTEEIINF